MANLPPKRYNQPLQYSNSTARQTPRSACSKHMLDQTIFFQSGQKIPTRNARVSF